MVDQGLLAAVLVGVGASAVVAVAASWDSRRRLPRGVLKRISQPGRRHRIRVGFMTSMAGAWDPSKRYGFENPIHDSGAGVYWLDADNLVHLDWTPKHGQTRHLTGPVPALRVPRRTRMATWSYAVLVAGGFVIAALVTSGSAVERASTGVFGAVIAVVVMWLIGIAMTLRRSSRGRRPKIEK